MTLQEGQANLFSPWNSAACGGGARDRRLFGLSLRAGLAQLHPRDRGRGLGAVKSGSSQKVPAQPTVQPPCPSGGTSRSWQALTCSTPLLPGFKAVRGSQDTVAAYCHDQTHQHSTGRGPSIHSLLVPASPETTQKSVLSLLHPSCLGSLSGGL